MILTNDFGFNENVVSCCFLLPVKHIRLPKCAAITNSREQTLVQCTYYTILVYST